MVMFQGNYSEPVCLSDDQLFELMAADPSLTPYTSQITGKQKTPFFFFDRS
jgi:hypothetical protein